MSDPISGVLGALHITCWIADAPTGQEEAFHLLTTDDVRAPQTMRLVAEVLGVSGPPGSAPTEPEVRVSLSGDGWATLHTPGGGRIARPVSSEWRDVARERGRVVLVVGFAPLPAGMDADTYTDRCGNETAISLVPLR